MSSQKIKSICRQISVYTQTGMTVLEAFQVVRSRLVRKKEIHLFDIVLQKLSEGRNVSEAFLPIFEHNRSASTIRILLLSSEKTGNISKGFFAVYEFLSKMEKATKGVVSSVAYPIIVSIGSFLLVLLLIVFIFPKIVPLFNSLHAPVPATTRFVLSVSNFVGKYYVELCVSLLSVLCGFAYAFNVYEKFNRAVHLFLFKVPLLQRVLFATYTVTIAESVSVLLSSGIPITEAFEVVINNLNNPIFKQAFIDIQGRLEQGASISSAFENITLFKKTEWYDFLITGERTGRLAESFSHVSKVYQDELQELTQLVSKMTEPVLLVVIASVVIFIALSVLQPMYGILQYVSP